MDDADPTKKLFVLALHNVFHHIKFTNCLSLVYMHPQLAEYRPVLVTPPRPLRID